VQALRCLSIPYPKSLSGLVSEFILRLITTSFIAQLILNIWYEFMLTVTDK
jgi:hypothetical protein